MQISRGLDAADAALQHGGCHHQSSLSGSSRSSGSSSSSLCRTVTLLPPCCWMMVWLFRPRRITRRVGVEDPPSSWVMVAVELPCRKTLVDSPALANPTEAAITMATVARYCGFMEASYG